MTIPFMPESPEQHTARVLASWDQWLREHPLCALDLKANGELVHAVLMDMESWSVKAEVTQSTLIGCLANLLTVLEN